MIHYFFQNCEAGVITVFRFPKTNAPRSISNIAIRRTQQACGMQ